MKRTRQYLMTLATAIAALLLWGGTGGRAYAQLRPEYLSGQSGVLNIYGAGESKALPNGFIGPIDIYGYGQPGNPLTGGTNIVINSYDGNGYREYTNVQQGTWQGNCNSKPDWNVVSGINWGAIESDLHPTTYPCSGLSYNYQARDTTAPYTSTRNGLTDDGVSLVWCKQQDDVL